MIANYGVSCETCGQDHRLRIQVGHGKRQSHVVNCHGCNEPMMFALDLDQENAEIELNFEKNCIHTDSLDGVSVYVSSEMVAAEDQITNPFYFPWIHFASTVANHPDGHLMLRDASTHKKGTVAEVWEDVQKIWRLNSSKQYSIANKVSEKFCKYHEIENKSLRGVQYWFGRGIFKISDQLIAEIKDIENKNPNEFEIFCDYWYRNRREVERRSQFDIYSKFFKAFDEFSQIFPLIRMGRRLPDGMVVTSVNFESTRSFYSDAFEFFSENISIFAMLNNIKKGRSFDKFENLTLKKYLESNKANRRLNFSDSSVFMAACAEFDSDIRNACFHNSFFIKPDNQIVEYRPGGTGAAQEISFSYYLWKCVRLFEQINQLFLLSFYFETNVFGSVILIKSDASKIKLHQDRVDAFFLKSAGLM
jgi:hypothetical protein